LVWKVTLRRSQWKKGQADKPLSYGSRLQAKHKPQKGTFRGAADYFNVITMGKPSVFTDNWIWLKHVVQPSALQALSRVAV
jgi:hypothetical protein